MVSAEVLPSAAASLSKKDKLKEAGKLKLEAFRKKKAAEKAKKAASTSKPQNDDEKQLTEEVRQPNFGGIGKLNLAAEPHYQCAILFNNNGCKDQANPDFLEVQKTDKSSLAAGLDVNYREKTKETHCESAMNGGTQNEFLSSQSNDAESVKETVFPNGFTFRRSGNLNDSINVASSDSSGTFVPHNETNQVSGRSFSSHKEPYHQTDKKVYHATKSEFGFTYDRGETNSSSSFDFYKSPHSSSLSTPPSGIGRSLPNQLPSGSVKVETSSKRSCPSFLGSISTLKASSYPYSSLEETQPIPDLSTKSEGISSSSIGSYDGAKKSMINLPFSNNGNYYDGKWNDKELQYCSPKQDDDFSALEQHIEDLTQEKFSLQRGLEASRALAESLAAENAFLTEAYNHQGAAVNQIKSEMDSFQEEIKTQLTAKEAYKMEYTNAELECSAADERAKLLASEVIQLEERVLKLRSSELKLERQLEHALSESSSYKKKISRLERERRELQESIDAFQEDGASERSNIDMQFTGSLPGVHASSSTQLPRDAESILEITSISIPADQMGTIDNMNVLISEVVERVLGWIMKLFPGGLLSTASRDEPASSYDSSEAP